MQNFRIVFSLDYIVTSKKKDPFFGLIASERLVYSLLCLAYHEVSLTRCDQKKKGS